jgi:hypothetical protein
VCGKIFWLIDGTSENRNRRTDKQTNRRTDEQTNRRRDKQTNRQTDEQTNRHIDIQTWLNDGTSEALPHIGDIDRGAERRHQLIKYFLFSTFYENNKKDFVKKIFFCFKSDSEIMYKTFKRSNILVKSKKVCFLNTDFPNTLVGSNVLKLNLSMLPISVNGCSKCLLFNEPLQRFTWGLHFSILVLILYSYL